jgi:hypothetical protein
MRRSRVRGPWPREPPGAQLKALGYKVTLEPAA